MRNLYILNYKKDNLFTNDYLIKDRGISIEQPRDALRMKNIRDSTISHKDWGTVLRRRT